MKLKISLNEFGLVPSDIQELEKFNLVTKWNWDYELCLNFQRSLTQYVRETGKTWLIICSHPDVLTHGRGLQRAKKGQTQSLEDYRPEAHPNLPVPIFNIERGGGLTFHHPEQIIIYPIMLLHPDRLSLSKLVDSLLISVKEEVEELGIVDLDHQRELLGLWYKSKKLASVGIAIDKMVTLHGLALNVNRFDELHKKLAFLSPCGMGFDIYTSLEQILNKKIDSQALADKIVRRLSDAW